MLQVCLYMLHEWPRTVRLRYYPHSHNNTRKRRSLMIRRRVIIPRNTILTEIIMILVVVIAISITLKITTNCAAVILMRAMTIIDSER